MEITPTAEPEPDPDPGHDSRRSQAARSSGSFVGSMVALGLAGGGLCDDLLAVYSGSFYLDALQPVVPGSARGRQHSVTHD